ncbi:MAG: hypothetical protein LC662_12965 [Rhodothermaceae bacterium]|nr:hypothetical protein [Rhodothermaceae bacterium]
MKWNAGLIPAKKRIQIATLLLDGTDYSATTDDKSVIDLRNVTSNPIDAMALGHRYRVVIEVEMKHCRNMGELAIPVLHDNNPLTKTMVELIHRPNLSYEDSFLKYYYENFQPKSAQQVLGIETDHDTGVFIWKNTNPLTAFTPWSDSNPGIEIQQKIKKMHEQARENGYELSDPNGWKWWGPVSTKLAELEFSRLSKLTKSFKQNGYLRHNKPGGDIGGIILNSGSEFRIIATGGQHRISACAAFGFSTLPIRPCSLVRRQDANSWPAVVDGYFSKKQALEYFDRIFEGKFPGSLESIFLK